jgi:hypothetical protein
MTSLNTRDYSVRKAEAETRGSVPNRKTYNRTISLTTMTSGVGDVKLSRNRESRNDKLANISASECPCVTSVLGCAGLGYSAASTAWQLLLDALTMQLCLL